MCTDPVFTRLTVKRGVSKITIAVKDTNIPAWHLLRLELYGFRAGIDIKFNLSSFSIFLILFFLVLEIIKTVIDQQFINERSLF